MSDGAGLDYLDFVDALREGGFAVSTARVVVFARAISAGGMDLYWSGRLSVVSSPKELALYDEIFGQFFGLDLQLAPNAGQAASVTEFDDGDEGGSLGSVIDLYERDLAELQEVADPDLAALITDLPAALAYRRGGRRRANRRNINLRRTVGEAVRNGGDVSEFFYRDHERVARPLIIAVDVSRSMLAYARSMLLVARVIKANFAAPVHVFTLGTTLTDVSSEVSSQRDSNAIADLVGDWGQGTQLATNIDALVRDPASAALIRGGSVVIYSDGLDADEPADLASAVEWLSRLAWRVDWINPLAGDPDYEPLQRSMVAALPHIRDLHPGHTLKTLCDAFTQIAKRDRGPGLKNVARSA